MEKSENNNRIALTEEIARMKKKNKRVRNTIWGICLFIIVVTSLGISFKIYNNSYGMGTLMLFGDARKPEIYKHEEIYTMVQFTDLAIMFVINVIGHFIEWIKWEQQNIHFYGITNIILCFTMLIIDSFKYGFEYLFVCPELKEIIVPITIFIIAITVINCLGYLFMIIRKNGINVSREKYNKLLNKIEKIKQKL